MKVAIIGVGNVGKTVFHDLQWVRGVDEIVLIGRSIEKAKAEVMDARDAAVLREEYGPWLHFGGYEAVKDADLIIYTAGSSKPTDGDRMSMLKSNIDITEEIFSEVIRYNNDAIIINATNPLDPITMKIVQVTGQDPRKVIGSGTLLETARLVRYIAELLELSDRSIHVSVVGEHGPTAVALLSSVRVLGMTLQDYLGRVTGAGISVNAERLNETFSREAFSIFQGKGYTSTGVSAAVCRIVAAIVSGSREIFPVSTVLQGEYGIQGVATSVPSVIGRNGVEAIEEFVMSEEEEKGFRSSVEKTRKAAISVNILKNHD